MNQGYDRLRRTWAELRDQWAIARQEWRDAVGDRFEREFWQKWESVVPQFLKALSDLKEESKRALRNTPRKD